MRCLLSLLTLATLLLGALGGWLLFGSQAEPESLMPEAEVVTPQPTEEAAIRAFLDHHVAVTNAEDLEGYMATIHPDSPLYATTEDAVASFFSTYDLRYEFSNVRIEAIRQNEADVRLDLTTTKISGPDFRDNRIDITFYLRQDGPDWKIYNQTINNVEYLD